MRGLSAGSTVAYGVIYSPVVVSDGGGQDGAAPVVMLMAQNIAENRGRQRFAGLGNDAAMKVRRKARVHVGRLVRWCYGAPDKVNAASAPLSRVNLAIGQGAIGVDEDSACRAHKVAGCGKCLVNGLAPRTAPEAPKQQRGKVARDDTMRVSARQNHSRVEDAPLDRKSTRLNSSHIPLSRMPSSA